ncbi:MAG TPA: hypothetical protein VFJ72_12220 [Rubrobacteraceae bacterium]|nr:hypothetical protein [Rubrobacteraceae bacterium]
MAYMINRYAPLVVISFSIFLLAGCSALTGDPREQANESISAANDSIAKHNRLFEQARDTYADVKKKVEAGDDPSKEKKRITDAKDTLQEARTNLKDAKDSLDEVQDLDVDPAVKKYSSTLSDAMDAQLAAEAKEIEFYGILEKDPALKDQRDKALKLLSEVGDGYSKAEKAYGEARQIANKNPKILGPAKTSKSGSGG